MRSDEQAQALPLVFVIVVVIALMAALVAGVGSRAHGAARAQAAADAGALAGAQALDDGPIAARRAARALALANGAARVQRIVIEPGGRVLRISVAMPDGSTASADAFAP